MAMSSHQENKPASPKPYGGKATRSAQLHKLLTRKSGVTLAQLQKIFGWQPHTARAAISAQRKAGCQIERSDSDRGSVYRVVRADTAA
ncbi:DUF3489 domain-containing protein [Ruegeria arenilitoris]|uniref:DUF3489 domain-containing protein n=1 Tax=Ruegeria arenilitoris TaxID=1173585 RepID=UPI00147BF0D6|nr:DUF3489 domain-containing protein [Ruegeria arenilitoris]